MRWAESMKIGALLGTSLLVSITGCASAGTPAASPPGGQPSAGVVVGGVTPGLSQPAAPDPRAPGSTAPLSTGGAPIAVLQQAGSSQQVGIWVTGEGRIMATPDIAVLGLGVEARASTVEAANSEAAGAMNKVIDALKANGVRNADIRTQAFNITPEYQYRDREAPKIIGYRVSNTVQAKMRELGKSGSIIDSVVKAGGDLIRIQGLRFDVDNPTPLLKEARDKAMEDAKAKAAQLASLGGVVLGKPIFISESGGSPVPLRQEIRALAAAPAAETPISPGEIVIQLNVQVTYAIQ